MALVPQDPMIFATSALENIRYGRPGATDAEVKAAATAAAADEFIEKTAQGVYDRIGRARGDAVGRATPTHRHRPRHPARCANPCCWTRRPRRWMPSQRLWCRQAVDKLFARPHDAGDRAPAGNREASRPDRGISKKAASSPRGNTTNWWPRAGYTHALRGCSSRRIGRRDGSREFGHELVLVTCQIGSPKTTPNL